jgi:xylulokinase
VRAGIGVDVAGTASVCAATTDSFRPDVKHRMLGCGRSAVPGLWHPYAYINGGGMNLEWFRREIASGGALRTNGMVTFEQLNKLAAQIRPKADGPMFLPHLGGRACPSEPHLRGAWIGLNWTHTQADLYRAALEAVALEYSGYQSVLNSLYPQFRLTELRVTGGGESSDLWNSIKADVLATTVRRIDQSEGAPRGAAMVAGWGVGVLKGLPDATKLWVVPGAKTSPNRSLKRHYAARSASYQSLLKSLRGLPLANGDGGAGA